VQWQWPDGGWNCDKNPEARNSSFMESLIPLRGLALHARLTGNQHSRASAQHAADIFLKRKLFRRQSDGAVINEDFVKLHYPCYWHYDILFGLKVMVEAGFIHDERCREALDLLEEKRLPDGGCPAEKAYYRVTKKPVSGRSPVSWGGTSKRRLNEFVTSDALAVLKASGRIKEESNELAAFRLNLNLLKLSTNKPFAIKRVHNADRDCAVDNNYSSPLK
jgi:hypothetical protein